MFFVSNSSHFWSIIHYYSKVLLLLIQFIRVVRFKNNRFGFVMYINTIMHRMSIIMTSVEIWEAHLHVYSMGGLPCLYISNRAYNMMIHDISYDVKRCIYKFVWKCNKSEFYIHTWQRIILNEHIKNVKIHIVMTCQLLWAIQQQQ